MLERRSQRQEPADRDSTVLLVEDHTLYREALGEIVQHELGPSHAVRTAADLDAALAVCRATPDIRIVLLDIGLPGVSGFQAMSALRGVLPGARFIMLTGSQERRDISTAERAGAAAFVSKAVRPATLGRLMHRLMRSPWQGMRLELGAAADMTPAGAQVRALSGRQRQVLDLVCDGHSNKEIGLRLGLAEVTVKQHVSAVLRHFGAKNRTQAAMCAHRLGSGLV